MRVCFNCGAGDELHDHHVVPRSLGGIATVPLCRVCHGKAHGRQRGFRDIAELTRVALAHLRAEGVVLGGAALGWAHTSKLDAAGRRVITEEAEEAAVVARIRELKADGVSVRRIADILTAEGLATKSGGRWHPTTVQRVIARRAS